MRKKDILAQNIKEDREKLSQRIYQLEKDMLTASGKVSSEKMRQLKKLQKKLQAILKLEEQVQEKAIPSPNTTKLTPFIALGVMVLVLFIAIPWIHQANQEKEPPVNTFLAELKNYEGKFQKNPYFERIRSTKMTLGLSGFPIDTTLGGTTLFLWLKPDSTLQISNVVIYDYDGNIVEDIPFETDDIGYFRYKAELPEGRYYYSVQNEMTNLFLSTFVLDGTAQGDEALNWDIVLTLGKQN